MSVTSDTSSSQASPHRDSCCYKNTSLAFRLGSMGSMGAVGYVTYSDLHALPGDELHAAHDVLLHLDELRQLSREVGAEGTGGIFTERMS